MTDPWRPPDHFAPGKRISVRRLTGSVPRFTDVIGVIESLDSDTVVLRTRQGLTTVRWSEVVAGREVPPAPPRRSARPAADG